jgi:hypothetical protein
VVLTASYGGREVHLDVELSSPAAGITPGHVDFTPGDDEGWVPEGATVAITAVPNTGFGFLEWSGAFLGMPNPTTVTANAPMEAGASFEVTFSADAPSTIQLPAAAHQTVQLQVENANLPVLWTLTSGELPTRMQFNPTGWISGIPMARGSFPLGLHVQDAIGLQDLAAITLEIVDLDVSLLTLASPFLATGALVTMDQRSYMDSEGNQNGAYDLGDFRAYLLRNPDVLLSAQGAQVERAPPGSSEGKEGGQ